MQKKIYTKAYVSYYIDLQVATSHIAMVPLELFENDESAGKWCLNKYISAYTYTVCMVKK